MTVLQRIKRRTIRDPSGCWIWMGAISMGYGRITISSNGSKKVKGVHRVMWELTNGPIPKGIFVLHTCDIRHCINPNHLFLGTQLDNMQDMIKKGRKSKIRWNTNITHCKHGHPFDEKNTYYYPNKNEKSCRTCQRAASIKHYHNNNGKEYYRKQRAKRKVNG